MSNDISPGSTRLRAVGSNPSSEEFQCVLYSDFKSECGIIWYDDTDGYVIIFKVGEPYYERDLGLFDRLCEDVENGGSPLDLLRQYPSGAIQEFYLPAGLSLEDRLSVLGSHGKAAKLVEGQ